MSPRRSPVANANSTRIFIGGYGWVALSNFLISTSFNIDFPRDIQPILDEHCLKCHDYEGHDGRKAAQGGVVLSGDHGPIFSHSYINC